MTFSKKYLERNKNFIPLLSKKERGNSLKIVGDIKTILNGQVSTKNLSILEPSDIEFGLGGITTNDAQRLGEGVYFFDKGYATYFDTPHYKTTSNKKILTPFFMGLEKNAQPTKLYSLNLLNSTSFSNLLLKLKKSHTHGFALVAILHFDKLFGAILKKPPIYNETLLGENSKNYWADEELFFLKMQ